ncbi:MAG TPA: ABC transporter substrate-binding protein [Candidatus Acidoferrum sp.]|nr:ABC transporter substrate-binding protein [Candidatus Acidoferrum sp.]
MFITFVGGAAATWPFTARGQQPRKIPWIGYLMNRSGPISFDESFELGLREFGYTNGQNIAIEYRWTEGKSELLASLAQELVALNVDVIVTAGADSTNAAQEATKSIPIVMASSQDAVGDGLVQSLARPGANVTGTLPNLALIGVLWNVQNTGGMRQLREAEKAGEALGVRITQLETRVPEGLEDAMARAAQAGAGAVLIVSDSSTISNRAEIGAAALRHRLSTIFTNKAYLLGGGLMSYGPDIGDSYRLSAVYVDKILKGAKPAELPVEQPTKFELAMNLKTAKALGIDIPPALLMRADEVIE